MRLSYRCSVSEIGVTPRLYRVGVDMRYRCPSNEAAVIPMGGWTAEMTMSNQEQQAFQAAAARAAIMNLNARHNRAFSGGDRDGWIATFRHGGAGYTRDGEVFTDLPSAFHGGDGQRLVTLDHEIHVDGVNATQHCVAVLFANMYGDTTLRATGSYRDVLIYERGGWYFAARALTWDVVPNRRPLVM